jgi:hypothetical protein
MGICMTDWKYLTLSSIKSRLLGIVSTTVYGRFTIKSVISFSMQGCLDVRTSYYYAARFDCVREMLDSLLKMRSF